VKKRILIVDDDQRMLDALRRALRHQGDDWAVTFIRRSELAWEQLQRKAYDVVVTDVRMPGLSGMKLLERIRQSEATRDIPVVVLTGLNDRELKKKALEWGAADLLTKPVDIGQLVARLRGVLQSKAHQDELRATNHLLAKKIERQNADLARSRMSVIRRLGMAAELRDEDTGNHVIRVGCYSRVIAAALGMPQSFLEMLLLTAPLHDIGKIGIPDRVLLKSGPLTDGEWIVMQSHCEIGHGILCDQSKVAMPLFDWFASEKSPVQDPQENNDPLLEMAASIALTHHEKWNGSGYPRGLVGEAIPLEARIVAVADVFDALTSNRPYRRARPDEEALTIIGGTVGSHFDPRVHEAFVRSLPEIHSIRARFADDMAESPCTEGAFA